MTKELVKFYSEAITPAIANEGDYERFVNRIQLGNLTRDENPLSHTCAMFLTYNPNTQEVLLIHHKKANSWILPGGHVDFGELPPTTIVREANEELRLIAQPDDLVGPFGAQVLDIDNPPQPCREHFDIFYAVAADPSLISVDMQEFLGYEWLPVDKAKERISLQYYKDALDKFVQFMNW